MSKESGFNGIDKRGGQTSTLREETYNHFTDEEMKSEIFVACSRSHRGGWDFISGPVAPVLRCFHTSRLVPKEKQI